MMLLKMKKHDWNRISILGLAVILISVMQLSSSWAQVGQVSSSPHEHLSRANVFLMAGDYRRAVEACQKHIDHKPSVEAYVYLAYVYQALDGYLDYLVKKEDYVKVEQLALNLTAREVIDLIDPPTMLTRMAQELIHEGIRQQFDVTSAMANRLSRTRTEELWAQQALWRELNSQSWWASAPEAWGW